MTPAERALRATLASHTKWGRTLDRTAATLPGRTAFEAKFEATVRAEFPDADDGTVAKLVESLR
jgi:hypothetical protein